MSPPPTAVDAASTNTTLNLVSEPAPEAMEEVNVRQMNGNSNGTATTVEYYYPKQLMNQPRPVRLVIIGAGIAGIAAVKLFKERFANLPVTLAIYEKNADVGGTWLENRYPGYV